MATFQAVKLERLTPRSVATRAKLIAVAERLFALRSIEAVSLNEINRAAGQRNSNACQYHFGSKDGLLQAIIDKHVLPIVARRNEMLDRMETTAHSDLREVVKAFVYPVAEHLCDPDGGKEFIRVNAQLIVPSALSIQQHSAAALHTPGAERLMRVLRSAIAPIGLPEPIVQQRLLLAAMLLFHGLADHSRMLEAVKHDDPAVDTELFVHDLEDSMVALLSAPLSTNTAARLRQLASQ